MTTRNSVYLQNVILQNLIDNPIYGFGDVLADWGSEYPSNELKKVWNIALHRYNNGE